MCPRCLRYSVWAVPVRALSREYWALCRVSRCSHPSVRRCSLPASFLVVRRPRPKRAPLNVLPPINMPIDSLPCTVSVGIYCASWDCCATQSFWTLRRATIASSTSFPRMSLLEKVRSPPHPPSSTVATLSASWHCSLTDALSRGKALRSAASLPLNEDANPSTTAPSSDTGTYVLPARTKSSSSVNGTLATR
jgi:hypothetical protein